MDLALLLQGRAERLPVLPGRVWRATWRLPRHLLVRLGPLLVSFFSSFFSDSWVSHIGLRSSVGALLLVCREPLRKEVPRVAIYLIELPENDVLRLGEDLVQLHVLYLSILESWLEFLHLDGGAAHLTQLLGKVVHSDVPWRMLRKDFLLCVVDVDEILYWTI